MMKINFKQPKYIFPLVVFIPLCALVYFVMQTFGGGSETKQTVATHRINTVLPKAQAEEAGDKMYEMSRRFGDEDAFWKSQTNLTPLAKKNLPTLFIIRLPL